MIQKNENQNKDKYVSCIKINGIPVLPPLITLEKHKQLLKCKQQAIKIEKRQKRDRELRTYIKKYYLPKLVNENTSSSTWSAMNTLEQQLSFGDDVTGLNVIRDSDILVDRSNTDVPCIKQKLSCELQVSQYINNEFVLIKNPIKDCNTLQTNSVVGLFEDLKKAEQADRLRINDIKLQSPKDLCDSDICAGVSSPKQRLIRSNSYTLETPSPVLLEHLKKHHKMQEHISDREVMHPPVNSNLTLTKRQWSSLDNEKFFNVGNNDSNLNKVEDTKLKEVNITDLCQLENAHEALENAKSKLLSSDDENSNFDAIKITCEPDCICIRKCNSDCAEDNLARNTSCASNEFNKSDDIHCIYSSETESELKNISDTVGEQLSNGGDFHLLGSESILKEFIDNNIPHRENGDPLLFEENIEKLDAADIDKSSTNAEQNNIQLQSDEMLWEIKESIYTKPSNSGDLETNTEFRLKQVLDNIPEIYSKQILELLEKQRQEHELRIESYQKIKQSFLDKELFSCLSEEAELSCVRNNDQSDMGRLDSQFCNPELQENRPCEVEKTVIKSSRMEVINEDTNLQQISNIYYQNDSFETINGTCYPLKERSKVLANCSRELFPINHQTTKVQTQEDWAASILGAAIKGYLTRRLLRTDRVQGLIQTIKDTLICAVQLHTETADDINESDVELHRRLIQQVSAACDAFHDTFFLLPIKEQMAIIRIDRQKQKIKLKQPSRANSQLSNTNKTPRSSRTSTHSK